mgnify:CR=1 FL=1|tara:strand:+ start:1595 stop:1909 length:315 start_codon:yes stop_codon:yes gene_type:complete
MPYTQEELKNLSFYQNLIDEDEQHYLLRKEFLQMQALVSGSAAADNLLSRDKSGAILLFENPYTDSLVEDPSSKLIHNTTVKLLKTTSADTIIDEVLDRGFGEL